MALTRPTLLSQVAFDATQQQTFKFVAQSSSQITANLLIIRNNDTNDIVYQEKQETFKYEHIVNANELTNGIYYNATITIFDNEGNLSRCSKKAWEKVWNDTTSGKIKIKFTQGYESIVPKQYIAYKKAH